MSPLNLVLRVSPIPIALGRGLDKGEPLLRLVIILSLPRAEKGGYFRSKIDPLFGSSFSIVPLDLLI